MLVRVINTTLETCDYSLCTDECRNYLWAVANNCSHVFNNETYNELWRTLISICYGTGH
jgi:hypothetical protein